MLTGAYSISCMFVISHELSSRVQTHICTKCIDSYEFTKQKGNSLIGQSLNKDYMGEFDMKDGF